MQSNTWFRGGNIQAPSAFASSSTSIQPFLVNVGSQSQTTGNLSDEKREMSSLETYSDLYLATEKPPTDAALLHALDQASHAECEPGTTDDLLTIILNRPARPWGFSYADLTHPTMIWWGSEDERISEKSVRWLERTMSGETELKVVRGGDHNLMRSVPVMCEIFQSIADETR